VVNPERSALLVVVLLTGALLLALHADAQTRTAPVWIDTDPAVGVPGRDVDDGFALIQAFRSPELEIRGVSVVFGNASLEQGLPIARRLVADHAMPNIAVTGGAAVADQLGEETDASRALADALGREALTVLMLGPATNIATVLLNHPELSRNAVRVIAVAGRRPGQRFVTGTTGAPGHRDFNFESDPAAFQVLLDSGVPLVLAPFEISSKIWIGAADLDRFEAGPASARALAAPSRPWLELWQNRWDVDGFNPFDTLAVGYAVSSDGFECETLSLQIQMLPDDVTDPGEPNAAVAVKPYLIASPTNGHDSAPALYCATAPLDFKSDLIQRLLR